MHYSEARYLCLISGEILEGPVILESTKLQDILYFIVICCTYFPLRISSKKLILHLFSQNMLLISQNIFHMLIST